MKQSQILANYRKTKASLRETRAARCEDCGATTYLTPSHTIAQKDAKNYGTPELIWDELNIVIQCQDCHRIFEEGAHHQNSFTTRMAYTLSIINVLQGKINEQTGPGKAQELAQRYINKIKDPDVRARWSCHWDQLIDGEI
tara:strand:- start:536 stop:958 length:423 start_codon:yes stop_codon:yes gene_type:complete